MDLGREKDLSLLKQRFSDETLPRLTRKRAERCFYRIRTQLKDKKIRHLRHQLISAHFKGDVEAAENIGEMMMEYEQKHYGLPVAG